MNEGRPGGRSVDIHRSQGSPIAEEAIGRIARLYAVEKEARGSPPDRRAERPAAHLQHFSGVLHVDGYAGFEQLARKGDVVLAACWAHLWTPPTLQGPFWRFRQCLRLHSCGWPVP